MTYRQQDDGEERGLLAEVFRQELERVQGRVRHEEYRQKPLEWLVEHLGFRRESLDWEAAFGGVEHEWDGTRQPLLRVLEGLAEWRDVGVESATGTGKSYLAAGVILWFLSCWRGARVFTFAPKEDQLRLHILFLNFF